MNASLVALFSAVLVIISCAGAVLAECAIPGSPRQELERSDAVFAGKVIRQERRKITNPEDEHFGGERLFVVLAINKTWKGDLGKEVVLRTSFIYLPDDTVVQMAEDFRFTTGESYLVYAFYRNENWATTACTRTKKLADAKDEMEEL